MNNEELIKQFVKDRDIALINATMDDDWDGLIGFCKKYEVPYPPNKDVMKAGVYKAIQEVVGVPQEVKNVAYEKCVALGFKPRME